MVTVAMDTVDKATRSHIMSRVGQKNTGPEMRLRKALHHYGLRYRLHDKRLPGSPDIVFPRFKAVLFVHGCFWHSHGCEASTIPKTHKKYWIEKFESNVERDRKNKENLLEEGWRMMVVWECVLKGKNLDLESVVRTVSDWLRSETRFSEFGERSS